MRKCGFSLYRLGVILTLTTFVNFAQASGPHAVSPYKLKVFATAPAGLSAPDSVVVFDNHVFVGYGDGHAPDGSDGKNSQVVEYRMDGTIVHVYTVPGHNDGLKVDPVTHKLWALQNEDANANLVVIDTESQRQKLYKFGPTLHGGGYDDIVFLGCQIYISASNPARNPNTGPAIVSAHLEGDKVEVDPVLMGDSNAIDLPTDANIRLNLQDPDSMTSDLLGNIVLDSQADQELIIVTNPSSSNKRALRLPLSYVTASGLTRVETDDTAFVTSSEGFLIFADKNLNAVYIIEKKAFAPGAAYTAADGGPFVGTVDMTSGIITPVVTGLGNPGGMVFVDTSDRDADGRGFFGQAHNDDYGQCRDSNAGSR
jgi:hypothetical protein